MTQTDGQNEISYSIEKNLKRHLNFINTGVITSPNYPENYPHSLEKIQTIQVEAEKGLRLEFTNFAVGVCGGINNCSCDHVNITDGEGATLMDKSCGYSSRIPTNPTYFKPPPIVSRNHIIHIFFHSDRTISRKGWSLNWTSVTQGHLIDIFVVYD